jgi:type IV secretory pathway VirB6-like protein
MKHIVYLLVLIVLIFSAGSIFADNSNCFGSPSAKLNEITDTSGLKSQWLTSNLVAGARIIFGAMVIFAIIFQFLAYLGGQLDLKGSIARLLFAAILLNGYESTDNFRYTIRNSAEKIGVWIRDGSGPEALLANIGKLFSRTIGTDKGEGWLSGIWNALETAAKLFLTLPGWITILFILVSIIVAVLSFVIDIFSHFMLLILDIMGPFCIAMAATEATSRICYGWITRWIEYSLWPVIYSCFMFAITVCYSTLLEIVPGDLVYNYSIEQAKCNLIAMLLTIVLGLISIFLLMSVPSIAASISTGRSLNFARGLTFAIGFIPQIAKSYVTRKIR